MDSGSELRNLKYIDVNAQRDLEGLSALVAGATYGIGNAALEESRGKSTSLSGVALQGGRGSSAIQVGAKLPDKHSFWLLGAVLAFLFFPASAPAPLYAVYEAKFMFSSITLTAIFAAYAVALLATLLVTGRLSDHLGRRPVLMLALVVQVAGMFVFIIAQGVDFLYLGRILQGVAVGLATGTITPGFWTFSRGTIRDSEGLSAASLRCSGLRAELFCLDSSFNMAQIR
jgi:hypothetical protein